MPCPLRSLLLLMFCHVMLWFVLSRIFRRNDLADVAWGGGLFAIMTYLIVAGKPGSLAWTLYGMVVLWAGRLSVHILFRVMQTSEDFRYRTWRESWKGSEMLRSFGQIFLLQAMITLTVSAPLIMAGWAPGADLTWWQLPGVMVWLAGFLIETIADAQLRRYISMGRPQGRFLRSGLWKYSRHPNYAGEILIWWGFFLMALPIPFGWITVLSPILMTWLLYRVSGVPLLEARHAGDETFREYRATTPAILPGLKDLRRMLTGK